MSQLPHDSPKSKVVLVLGMHRSGTSLLAQILHRIGVYWGEPDQLMPANDYNLDGYWEYQPIVKFHDRVLRAFGGDWKSPPTMVDVWWTLPEYQHFVQEAQILIQPFRSHPVWGWKDPRTVLLLPFWQAVLDDYDVYHLLMVRNPLEVALSLSPRDADSVSFLQALHLWVAYQSRLHDVDTSMRVDFDALVDDSQTTLQRIVDFIGESPSKQQMKAGLDSVKPEYRHYQSPMSVTTNWLPADITAEVSHWFDVPTTIPEADYSLFIHQLLQQQSDLVDEYVHKLEFLTQELKQGKDSLRKQRQTHTQHLQTRADQIQELNQRVEKRAQQVEHLNQELQTRAEHIQKLDEQLQTRADQIQELNQRVEKRTEQVEHLNQELQTRAEHIQKLDEQLQTRAESNQNLDHELETRADRIQELNQQAEQQTQQIEQLNQELQTRTESIQQLEQDLETRAEQVEHLNQELQTRAEHIRKLDEQLETQAQELQDETLHISFQDQQLQRQAQQLEEHLAQIQLQDQKLLEQDQQIQELEGKAEKYQLERSVLDDKLQSFSHQIDDLQQELVGRERHIQTLLTSTSWKITRPLRFVRNAAKNASKSLTRDARQAPHMSKPASPTSEEGSADLTFRIEVDGIEYQDNTFSIAGWVLWEEANLPLKMIYQIDDTVIGESWVNLSRPELFDQFPKVARTHLLGYRFVTSTNLNIDNDSQFVLTLVDRNDQQQSRIIPLKYLESIRPSDPDDVMQELEAHLSQFKQMYARPAYVLNWHSPLKIQERFSDHPVFTPPQQTQVLPYLDATIDLVVVGANGDHELLEEAQRVARFGVFNYTGTALESHWLHMEKPTIPSASIIIPIHNQPEYTRACIEQVHKTLPENFRGEVIAVDDGSDETTQGVLQELQEKIATLRVIRNEQAQGFVRVINRAAQTSTNDYLVLLNNDTLPQPEWFTALLRLFDRHEDVGAVGGKLTYPDGSLQEAGGVIFSDGSGWNFGKNDPYANRPIYDHVREVDYCSGALLATLRSVWEEVGGFDEQFAPAYYEDADYCFSLRQHGYRVLYQPASVVIHYEGVSAGRDTNQGMKRYQTINREKFVNKWRDQLILQPGTPMDSSLAAHYALLMD